MNIQKRDIRVVYRVNKLQPEETNWLGKQIGVRTSLCKTLHAKCYLNENEAIITSMNLSVFTGQQQERDGGFHVTKEKNQNCMRRFTDEALGY